jgi:hypothetical protein
MCGIKSFITQEWSGDIQFYIRMRQKGWIHIPHFKKGNRWVCRNCIPFWEKSICLILNRARYIYDLNKSRLFADRTCLKRASVVISMITMMNLLDICYIDKYFKELKPSYQKYLIPKIFIGHSKIHKDDVFWKL